MSLLSASWSWDTAATSTASSASSPSSSSSSPKSLSSAHFTSTSQSEDCPATASTSSLSSTTTTTPYKSKSDAFFSSYASMAPIKPPSPIFSRRASDSCLPPPCAASAKLAARVSAGTQSVQSTPSTSSLSSSSSSYSGRLSSNARERFSSLPDIREHQGLCIRSSLPSESLASSSSSSSIVPSTSASGSSSPASSSSNRQSSSIEDIEARLQAAISNLSGNSSSNEEDSDGDMYNDTPSCSSSSSALRSSNVRQQEQQSVFEEEDDEDDENGGTTIRIRLASAGDLPKTMSTTRQSKNYNGQFSEDDEENLPFEPCYPLKPLEIDYKPNHRIKRNRSLRRALSDSCTTIALQSHSRQKNDQEDNKGRRKVHFLDSVQVVDVFAAIDYPARRGPPPIERLTMRDVLELRQIKLELAAYMGEELPEPEIQQSAQEEQSFEGEREDFKDETSLPTTPALEGSPMLEQMGEVTPLASSINSSISKEERKFESSEKGSAVSTSRSSSSSLGPGIQIDLHSLIAPITIATSVDTAGTGHTEGGDNNDEQDDCLSSAIDSATSISSSSSLPTSTSFDYSSPPSSIPGSEDNSLSCSPVTSDSEFGSGSGTLSSCEEYDDLLLRRGSGDTSCDDDEEEDEEDQNDALIGIQGNNTLGQAFNGEHSSRTPTRVSSLLRPGQYTSPSSAKSRKRTSSTSSLSTTTSKKEMSKIEVGCIQIALPVLDENHGFPVFNTNRFDFSNPATHHEAWKPPTF